MSKNYTFLSRPNSPNYLQRRTAKGGSSGYKGPTVNRRNSETDASTTVPVDLYHPNANDWQVVEENGVPYHAVMTKKTKKLGMTRWGPDLVPDGKEREYVLQVIKKNNTGQYRVWMRYNLIGTNYKRQWTELLGKGDQETKESCIAKFKNKFYQQTLGRWDYLDQYEPRPEYANKYEYIPLSASDRQTTSSSNSESVSESESESDGDEDSDESSDARSDTESDGDSEEDSDEHSDENSSDDSDQESDDYSDDSDIGIGGNAAKSRRKSRRKRSTDDDLEDEEPPRKKRTVNRRHE